MTSPDECDMTLAKGVGCTAMDDRWPMVDGGNDTWRLQTRGSGTEGGDGGGGQMLLVDATAVGGCDRRGGGGGGGGSNAKAEMVCAVSSIIR